MGSTFRSRQLDQIPSGPSPWSCFIVVSRDSTSWHVTAALLTSINQSDLGLRFPRQSEPQVENLEEVRDVTGLRDVIPVRVEADPQ